MSITSLPRAGELIKISWQDFTKHWETAVRVSAWIIVSSILASLPVFIPAPQPIPQILTVIFGIAAIAIAIWSSVRLYQTCIHVLDGKKSIPTKPELAYPLILPSILVGILTMLSTIGGFILLVIPGIYIAVRLSFSQIALIEDDERGTNALKTSWKLTSGRFWPIAWRHLAFGLLMILIIAPATWLSLWIVGIISGIDLSAALADEHPQEAVVQISNIINSILQAAIAPFITFYIIRLYRALKKTEPSV